jgi:argininosuccinate lyase
MKLWDKGYKISKEIEEFTVGKDRDLDLLLAKYDVRGSIAHGKMLEKIGLLSKSEFKKIYSELIKIVNQIENKSFKIRDDVEDVHSQIEFILIQALGETGKRIHAGRSRNDQILLDIRLMVIP